MIAKYLNKKKWHPSSMSNIEQVWLAESKQREAEKREQDHIKKLKEERQIEELKILQAKMGIIPQSSLQRIDWMYQDRSAQNNGNNAEDFLLGKPVKEIESHGDRKEPKKIIPVIRDSYTTTENEAFVKMMEDPLVYIK